MEKLGEEGLVLLTEAWRRRLLGYPAEGLGGWKSHLEKVGRLLIESNPRSRSIILHLKWLRRWDLHMECLCHCLSPFLAYLPFSIPSFQEPLTKQTKRPLWRWTFDVGVADHKI